MSDYGIGDDGSFTRKHIDTIREDVRDDVQGETGSDVSVRQGAPLRQIIDGMAVEFAHQWEVLEQVYYAGFYEDSFGEQLDKQLALAGFSRLAARSATGEVEFSRAQAADDDITIPEGTVVTTRRTETKPEIPFETTEEVILSAGSTTVTAPIEALKPWQSDLDEDWLGAETNVAADTIDRIDDAIAGIEAVTNPDPTGDEDLGYVSGRDRESDAEFKLRYENSLAGGGTSTGPAMESRIFNYDEDIISVRVDEVRNDQDGYGPRVTVFAPGVVDDDIAQAILESRAAGTESIGGSSGTAEFDDGTGSTEEFDRATEVTVYVDAQLTTSDAFPADGVERIRDRIIRYVGGEASDGITYPGLEIGEDAIYDQIFRRVMEVGGVIEADLQIGDDSANLAEANIAVGDREAAMTGIDEVTVNE